MTDSNPANKDIEIQNPSHVIPTSEEPIDNRKILQMALLMLIERKEALEQIKKEEPKPDTSIKCIKTDVGATLQWVKTDFECPWRLHQEPADRTGSWSFMSSAFYSAYGPGIFFEGTIISRELVDGLLILQLKGKWFYNTDHKSGTFIQEDSIFQMEFKAPDEFSLRETILVSFDDLQSFTCVKGQIHDALIASNGEDVGSIMALPRIMLKKNLTKEPRVGPKHLFFRTTRNDDEPETSKGPETFEDKDKDTDKKTIMEFTTFESLDEVYGIGRQNLSPVTPELLTAIRRRLSEMSAPGISANLLPELAPIVYDYCQNDLTDVQLIMCLYSIEGFDDLIPEPVANENACCIQ